MVSKADLDRISALSGEFRAITLGLEIFDTKGRIISLEVSNEANTAKVETVGLYYPPEMVEAIKKFLNTRRQGIRDQLTALGITDFDEPEPPDVTEPPVESPMRRAPPAAAPRTAPPPPRQPRPRPR